jgi:hypothetical protein
MQYSNSPSTGSPLRTSSSVSSTRQNESPTTQPSSFEEAKSDEDQSEYLYHLSHSPKIDTHYNFHAPPTTTGYLIPRKPVPDSSRIAVQAYQNAAHNYYYGVVPQNVDGNSSRPPLVHGDSLIEEVLAPHRQQREENAAWQRRRARSFSGIVGGNVRKVVYQVKKLLKRLYK